ERRDAVLGAVEDGGLGGRRRAGQPGREAANLPAVALDELLEVRHIAALESAFEVFVRQGVDLDDDEAASEPFGGVAVPAATPFRGERQILQFVVPTVESPPEAAPP